MPSSIPFCSGKKEYCVGTEVVCSVPVSLFIKPGDDCRIFFSEADKFRKVNVNHLTDIPIFVEYLSGKGQLSMLLFIVYVALPFTV